MHHNNSKEGFPVRNTILAMIVLGCASFAQAAELKIAIVDPLGVVAGTDQYKKAAADLDKELAGDKARVTKLQSDLNACRQKMQKDGATMSATEQARLKTDCEAKFTEFQTLGQRLNKIVSEREQAVLKDMGPKVEQVINQVAKEGGYDIVLQREAALFAKPELDITAKVVAKLNAAK